MTRSEEGLEGGSLRRLENTKYLTGSAPDAR
jgi:hypothetical protein